MSTAMKSLACAMTLTLIACGSDVAWEGGGPDAGEVADGAAPATSEPLPCAPCAGDRYDYDGDGRYEVPLDPEHAELGDAAFTPVFGARLRIDEGQVSLSYDFPLELTGVDQSVDFDGPLPEGDGPLVLAGDPGTATCSIRNVDGPSFDIHCFEELPGVDVDVAALETLLEERGVAPAEIAARIDVAKLFSEDPIGIFEGRLSAD